MNEPKLSTLLVARLLDVPNDKAEETVAGVRELAAIGPRRAAVELVGVLKDAIRKGLEK